MGLIKSVYRFVVSLGGLLVMDEEVESAEQFYCPKSIKAEYQKTRDVWTNQYDEIRKAVAHLIMAVKQKNRKVESLNDRAEKLKFELTGAVHQFSRTKEEKYRTQFNQIYKKQMELDSNLAVVTNEIEHLDTQIDMYKSRLNEMKTRLNELNVEEAEVIADIVSSQQLIKLNENLSNYSINQGTENLESLTDRRDRLKVEADISASMLNEDTDRRLEDEISAISLEANAADAFTEMLSKEELNPYFPERSK